MHLSKEQRVVGVVLKCLYMNSFVASLSITAEGEWLERNEFFVNNSSLQEIIRTV